MAGRLIGRALIPLAGAALGTPSTGARDYESQGDAASVRDDTRVLEEGELEAVLPSLSSFSLPSVHEVDSAIEAIATTRPDLVGRILPARSMQSTMESVVREIILDENLLRAALSKMSMPSSSSSKHKRSLPQSISEGNCSVEIAMAANCSQSTSGCTPSSWQKMRSSNTCSICLDLLAAPLISSSCGHSFCGICVTSYLSAFDAQCIEEQQLASSLARAGLPTQRGRRRERTGLRSFSGGLLMVTRKKTDRQCVCPTCRRPLTTLTFERVLDNVIASMVEGVAPFDLGRGQGQGQGEHADRELLESLVRDWRERRAAYHSRVLELKCSSLKLDDSDDDDCSSEFGSSADDNDGSWESYVLPVIFALVALIMIVRSRQ